MRQLIVKQLDYDLTPVAGLALVGHYLLAVQPTLARLDAALPIKGGVANSDIVRSYLGLLVQGKSDFDAIENFRGDAFFKQALGIGLLPSSPTLRQRMDAKAAELFDFVPSMIQTLLAGQRPDYGVLPCGWLPLDIDTFATQGCRGAGAPPPAETTAARSKKAWAYVFPGYREAASRNCKPALMDALHAGADAHQPVGTAASGRGSKLGDVVLAMDAKTAACMNFHRSTPWRRQVS